MINKWVVKYIYPYIEKIVEEKVNDKIGVVQRELRKIISESNKLNVDKFISIEESITKLIEHLEGMDKDV